MITLAPFQPNEKRCRRCKQYFRPQRKHGTFCSKRCGHEFWNEKRKSRTGEARHRIDPPKYATATTLHPCGGVWVCETRDGTLWERCTKCRTERPVRMRGLRNRKLDQRKRLDAELKARTDSAKAVVDEAMSNRAVRGHGDSWRQASHKRGAA